MWGKIISFASKYGPKAVKWCWNHKGTLINAGLTAFDIISRMFS